MEAIMIPLILFSHIPQCILGSPFVEFIDCDQVGEVEHVDLFKLAGRTELRSHHIECQVTVVYDFGIGLSDT